MAKTIKRVSILLACSLALSAISTASCARAYTRARHVQAHEHSGGIRALITASVSARLGPQWVSTALRIVQIESGGNCRAYNRGAIGVFQVRNPERFGVSAAQARTCAGGVSAGVAHMVMCRDKGARSPAMMMACHNSGSPFARHVERAYRFALARRG
jgi:hypothetical protein